eukprot:5931332-Amphidinium_carterae.1
MKYHGNAVPTAHCHKSIALSPAFPTAELFQRDKCTFVNISYRREHGVYTFHPFCPSPRCPVRLEPLDVRSTPCGRGLRIKAGCDTSHA